MASSPLYAAQCIAESLGGGGGGGGGEVRW